MMIRNIASRNYVLILGGIKNIAHSFFLLVFVFFAGSAMALDLGGMLKKLETVAGEQSAPAEKRETAQEQHERELSRLREAEKKREADENEKRETAQEQHERELSRLREAEKKREAKIEEEDKKRYEIAKQKEAEREERRIAHQKEQEEKAAADKIAKQKEEEEQKKKREEGYKVEVQLVNKLFVALKSPMLNKAYTACQNKESARISRNIQQMKEQAKLAKTVAQRDGILKSANELEKVRLRIAPATCWVRMFAKSRETLEINDNGVYLKDVLVPIVYALEHNEFTSNFYSELANDLQNHDNDQWLNQRGRRYYRNVDELAALLIDNPDYVP